MARPVVLQDDFSRGIKQDFPRDAMPVGTVWSAVDLLPARDAKLQERSGWTYASDNIASTKATASRVDAGLYAPFAAAAKNLAIDEDGELYSIASNGTVTDVGAAVAVSQNPVFHRDKAIIPAAGGATAPRYYDGTTLGNLAGSPPNAVYGAVWNDYTLLARSSANTNRLWFSGAGDPTSWDTTNGFWDFSYPITGLAALRTAILVFHDGYVSRLRGAVPPPGGDLQADDPVWAVGCPDAFALAYWRDSVIFANATGVYITDGSGVADLTALCGQKLYWQSAMASYAGKASSRMAAGVFNDYCLLTYTNAIGTSRTEMIDLNSHSWWRLSNTDARAYWSKEGSSDELYWGRHGAARVGTTSTMFINGQGGDGDADGDAVAGVLETPYYRIGGMGSKGWRRLFLLDRLDDNGTANPTVAVSYMKVPDSATNYTSLASYSENTAEQFRPMSLGFSSSGVAFKFARANNGTWRVNGIAADVHRREGSRP